MIFVEGVPQKIDLVYFRTHYGCKFPRLLSGDEPDMIVGDAIDAVYDMYTGVSSLWSNLDSLDWYNKTRRCYGLLTAWYITDMYPMYAAGIPSMGGVPIKAKSIGGVKITYDTEEHAGKVSRYKDALAHLRTNVFGVNAYNMIKTSSRFTMLRIGGR